MIKKSVKSILSSLHIDLTRNQRYDRLSRQIMKRVLQPGSNCVDIGCHKGEMLREMIGLAPEGFHFAFEPIPYLFKGLESHFADARVRLFNVALSDHQEHGKFHLVHNAPEYSGILKRRYETKRPDIEKIEVEITTLDACIPEETAIDFIKIDVEGGEFGVMKGAGRILQRTKPYVIFEFGLGAAEYYGSRPEDLHAYLSDECGLRISTLDGWLNESGPLSCEAFSRMFESNEEYYFLAHP